MKRLLIIILQFLLITAGCKNEIDVQISGEISQEQLKEDAAYNNKIVEGVGNVLYAQKLEPNTLSQLVLKIAYKADTIAYFGKINAEGKLEYIHTSVYATENNSKMFVRQIYPDEGTSRMYNVSNGVKSRFIVESINYNLTDKQISILDYDWSTGKYKTLASVLTRDGKVVADYSSERRLDVKDCKRPQPTDELDQQIDPVLQYTACGGIAIESHTVLSTLKTLFNGAKKLLKENTGNPQDETELDRLNQSTIKQSDFDNETNEKVQGLKSSKTDQPSRLDPIEELYEKPANSVPVPLFLVPFKEASDLDYDEVDDEVVKITFTVIHQETKLPFTELPVLIDMRIVVPGTNTVLYDLQPKYAHRANGQVVFRFDPYIVPANNQGKIYPKLEVQYKFGFDDWSNFEKQIVNIKHNIPKVVDEQGKALKVPVDFKEHKASFFKLALTSGNTPFNPNNYAHVRLEKGSNSKIAAFFEATNVGFSLKLSSADLVTPDQTSTFKVVYKDCIVDEISVRLKLNTPTSFSAIGGINQTGVRGKVLPKPLRVRITNKEGEGVSNTNVEWAVISGDGKLENVIRESDDNGYAETSWVLGNNELPQEVIVRSVNRAGGALEGSPLKFSAKISSGYKMEIVSKNVLGGYSNPFKVKVTDVDGKPIPGAEIDWKAIEGIELTSSDKMTNNEGIAEARVVFSLNGSYKLKAIFKSDESVSTTFNAIGYVLGVTAYYKVLAGYVVDSDWNSRRTNPFYIFFHDKNLIPAVGMLVTWTIGAETVSAVTNGVGAVEIKWKDQAAKVMNFQMFQDGKIIGSWVNIPL